MAHRTPSSKPRHGGRTSPAARTRSTSASAPTSQRARRGYAREERLRRERELHRELELRDHPPTVGPKRVPRLKTRNYNPFWKIVRRAVAVLALLGLVELGVAALTAEPFKVKQFEVTGCKITDASQVDALAQTLVGQNWVRATTKSVEHQIEQLPTVKDARVSRVLDWPPRLHVVVSERESFARVGAGEDWWVADKTGVVFRRADETDKDLYAVTSPKFKPQLGRTLPQNRWLPVVEIANELRTRGDQSWTLRRIYFDRDGSASLRLAGGFHDETLVRLGSDHWSEKLVRARQALSYFEQTGKRAAVLNLVSYEMPQWTPRAVNKPSSNESVEEPQTDSNNGTPISVRSEAASTDSET